MTTDTKIWTTTGSRAKPGTPAAPVVTARQGPASVQLGRSELRVSRMVLGCMFPSRLSEAEITRLLHAACDAGISSFDTAPLYDFHRSEEIMGRALRDRRQRVQLLTKAGLRWDDASGQAHGRELFSFTDNAGVRRVVRKNSRPDSLRREIEGSCKRLGTSSVDLLQIHHPDADTPIEYTISVLADLQRAGIVRAFGVSNYSAEQLQTAQAAAGATGLASLQSEYSLLERSPEQTLLPLCIKQRIGFLAYSPLAKGVFASHADKSPPALRSSRGSRFDHPLVRLPIALAVQTTLRNVAQAHHASTSQIALAWLLAQPALSAVVVGASSVEQVREAAEATAITLRPDEIRALEDGFAQVDRWLKAAARVQRALVLGKVTERLTRVLDEWG